MSQSVCRFIFDPFEQSGVYRYSLREVSVSVVPNISELKYLATATVSSTFRGRLWVSCDNVRLSALLDFEGPQT